ncbi:MAG: hypothetical protein ACNA77_06970 [Opitutales bacterium]
MAIQFIFLAYGADAAVHRQTMAAMASLYACHFGESARPEAVLYTDHPQYYSWLAPARIVSLSQETLDEWMGPQRFGFRVKACLLDEVARKSQCPIVYLDGDMILLKSLRSMEAALLRGQVFMQAREYLVAGRQTKERREFMSRLSGINLGYGVSLGEQSWMWNAGLIGLSEKALDAPARVVSMIDRMLNFGLSPRTRLKEQLAFSLYLDQRHELCEAGDAVLHYWGNKPAWDAWLDGWLLEVLGEGLSPEAAGARLLKRPKRPPPLAAKRSKAEKRRAKLRKLLRLD